MNLLQIYDQLRNFQFLLVRLRARTIYYMKYLIQFQFLLVRLRAVMLLQLKTTLCNFNSSGAIKSLLFFCGLYSLVLFQFLLVRLRVADIFLDDTFILIFQFLLVRLRDFIAVFTKNRINISIPSGAIKRPNSSFFNTCHRHFNSFWCD
jgi:CDP-diglyceride synthetase